MSLYLVAMWVLTVGGLVPTAYFLATFRPSGWARLAVLDAMGWLVVLGLTFAHRTARLLLGLYNAPTGWGEQAVALGVALAINVVAWVRLVYWRRFCREARAARAAGASTG